DLRQPVVVLRDERCTGGLRGGVGNRRGLCSDAVEGAAGARDRGSAERTDGRGRRIVGGHDVDLTIGDGGLQIVRRQRRVELVERRDLVGAETEGDAGRGAATGRIDGQRLAVQAVTLLGQAELAERAARARQPGGGRR